MEGNVDIENEKEKDFTNKSIFKEIKKEMGEEEKDIEQYYKSCKEMKWENERQFSFHFCENINKIWFVVSKFELLLLINDNSHFPCLIIKGQDTIGEGNQFESMIYGIIPFVGEVIKYRNYPEKKTIVWLLNLPKKEKIFIKLSLYMITEDNSCILFTKAKLTNKSIVEETKKYGFKFSAEKFFKSIDDKIKKDNKRCFVNGEFEIIHAKMKDLWDLILNNDKMSAIIPKDKIIFDFKNLKDGEKGTLPFSLNDRKGTFEILVHKKDTRPNWKKWIFFFQVIGGFVNKDLVVNQDIVIETLQISPYETKFSVISIFHEPLPTEKFNLISRKKKFILAKVKEYFEHLK